MGHMIAEELDRRDLKIMAAKMYYFEGRSQEEISKMIHLSRPSVSRLLNDCIKEGIVQIYIDEVSSYGIRLADQIKERYALKHVIVVPQSHSTESAKEKVGQAAAFYLKSILTSGMLVGISWGSTVFNTINNIKQDINLKCDVIELIGGRENQTQDTDANMMALKLAKTLNGNCYLLQAPFMVQSKVLHDLLLEEPHIKSHFEMIQRTNIALVGLGSTHPELSAQFRSGHISMRDTEKLMQEGVVGDVCGSYIDIEGNICNSALNERMIAVSLEHLRAIPTVIGVAAGEQKAEIITAALRGKYIDTLITDESAAIRVLEYEL
jgi:DNA-binding transcriptional regulator LsrR (DeoR family)